MTVESAGTADIEFSRVDGDAAFRCPDCFALAPLTTAEVARHGNHLIAEEIAQLNDALAADGQSRAPHHFTTEIPKLTPERARRRGLAALIERFRKG